MSRFDDPDSPDYQETNVGLGMVPDRKPRKQNGAAPQKNDPTDSHLAKSGERASAVAAPPDVGEMVRPCTCHPYDNPPVPCPRKYALSECIKAALLADRYGYPVQPKPEPGGEVCQECGRAYDDVYSVPDEVWARISPKPAPAGLLCPACALKKVVALSSQNVERT